MIFTISVSAQDSHYSHWLTSPINQNPANTGAFDGDGRVIMNYRTQWRTVKVPYNSFSFGGDFNMDKKLIKGTNQAVGFLINRDVAGDGNYSVTDIKIPYATKIKFKKDTTLNIAFGMLAGVTHINVFSNRLSYDAQWDGDAYNSNLPNGENFLKQSKTFFDASVGTVIEKLFSSKLKLTVGYGLHHITKPNISFNNTPGVLLRFRHNESLQLKYSINNLSALMFEYYGNQQQAFKQNSIGVSYYYTIDPIKNAKINAGLFNRFGDAAIASLGLEYNNMRFQTTYDFNYSQFKRATNARGAFEISFLYIYSRAKVFIPKTRVCPVFM